MSESINKTIGSAIEVLASAYKVPMNYGDFIGLTFGIMGVLHANFSIIDTRFPKSSNDLLAGLLKLFLSEINDLMDIKDIDKMDKKVNELYSYLEKLKYTVN